MRNLRKSSYLIAVPLQNTEGKHMLVHGYTGAIDIASKDIAECLNSHAGFCSEDEIDLPQATLDTLVARGYFTEKTATEEKAHIQQWASLFHKSLRKFQDFLFMVTYDCNFRCPYCYESAISADGRQWTKKTFSKEMVDRAYQAMLEIEPDINFHNKHITLYGGEPLLKENKEIVEYIVKQGADRGYNFSAITNGYALKEYEDLLDPTLIRDIQITLDGDKEAHELRRYDYRTHESFDIIFENIGLALNKGVYVRIRMNIDANNTEEINKLKAKFKEAGYMNNKLFNFHFALLHSKENLMINSSNPEKANSYSEKDSTFMSRKRFNELFDESGEVTIQDYGIYDKLQRAIQNKGYLNFQSVFCAVQTNEYIFDPYGEIYGCWETVGKKKYTLGSYKDTLSWTPEADNWRRRHVGVTPKCSGCKYALLCGGGCLARALEANGGEYISSYCDGYPDTFRIIANQVYKKVVVQKQQ
ncbi:MAG: radical SAM protein [Rikenellaceae bacterium]|nr:radical SAM protein [Rikenellaceae bacterium]